jgi:ABC-2 type transport system ATP-binding protein
MRNVITDLGKEKTVMLSTHIMQEVEAMCERVIMINKGNIVADDNLKELISKHQTSLEEIFKQLTQNVDTI